MKHIKSFTEHLNESYLKGSKQPLYHWTSKLEGVITSNLLKLNTPAYGYLDDNGETIKSISFTRSRYYSMDGMRSVRLVFDSDKLKNDGYTNKPFDEVAYAKNQESKNKNIISKTIGDVLNPKKNSYHKADITNSKRLAINNVGLERDPNGLEIEYEERIYKPIKNVGKYLIAIEFCYETTLNTYLGKEEFLKFLKIYPQIEVRLIDEENLWKPGTLISLKSYQSASF